MAQSSFDQFGQQNANRDNIELQNMSSDSERIQTTAKKRHLKSFVLPTGAKRPKQQAPARNNYEKRFV